MARSVQRRELQAYLIGAGIGGTVLIFPYTGRAAANFLFPELAVVQVPFFRLPVVWGLWNWLHVRFRPPVGIAAWGAVLGFVASLAVNILLYGRGQWFRTAALLPVFLPGLYYIMWYLIVGPLNEALEIDG